ncbi:transcription antitermination factor NusB [Flavobacteriaceae bacterium D16]|nr:transcription antitermination factor NusB [Flavobacteriaceae bacterium D16]
MLTRRQLRIKVMQCIYALVQSKDDSLEKQQKFLRVSIENTFTLYLLLLSLLRELYALAKRYEDHTVKKYLAEENPYPNPKKFLNNELLQQIVDNDLIEKELKRRKLNLWYLHEDYISLLYKEIAASKIYRAYMQEEGNSYEKDREFIIALYREVIAPNEKVYELLEDDKLTWVDDIPLVNTFIVKKLRKMTPDDPKSYMLPRLLKDSEDMEFAKELLAKTLLRNSEFEGEIVDKTPNWDKDRIAEIDAILLKMAICELLHFSSIPERVTLNEYLEIAKEYSTPKSSIFINGVLDKLVREYKADGKLKKTGRGLL